MEGELGLSDREKFFILAWMCLVMYYQYYNRNFVLGERAWVSRMG